MSPPRAANVPTGSAHPPRRRPTTLTTATIEGYRSFSRYELDGFARINLFVGQNNCGKTSLLEAIEFLVAKGHPQALLRSPDRRGEGRILDVSDQRIPSVRRDISHLFYDHDFASSSAKIRVEGNRGYGPIEARVRPLTDEEADELVGPDFPEDALPALGLEISGTTAEEYPILPVDLDGSLFPDRWRLRRIHRGLVNNLPNVRFLTPGSLDPEGMRTLWDRVQREAREEEVIDLVRLVVNDLKSIHFLASGLSRRSQIGGVLVGLRGGPRVPLGTQGDAMRRLLALSLSLIESTDGALMVDELDSGLHWTVMQRMWDFVIHAAVRSSVQVFATTHSLDCIRGLASLHRMKPELTSEVSVFKLDRRLDKAIHLDAAEVEAAMEEDIEIR